MLRWNEPLCTPSINNNCLPVPAVITHHLCGFHDGPSLLVLEMRRDHNINMRPRQRKDAAFKDNHFNHNRRVQSFDSQNKLRKTRER